MSAALANLEPQAIPQRLSIKLYAHNPPAIAGRSFVDVFHRWIRDRTVGRALIDLHNYSHVRNGPGVVLVGHEAQYRMDETDGKLGLRYVRKRELTGGWSERLQTVLKEAVHAALVMSREPIPEGHLSFTLDRFGLGVEDRAVAPNDASTAEQLAELARAAWGPTLGSFDAVHVDNPRGILALVLQPAQAPSLEALAAALGIESP